MGCFSFNLNNVKGSVVSFKDSPIFVDPNFRLMSISEMVAEARLTGNMPYSNIRPTMPSDEGIDLPERCVTDNLDNQVFINEFARSFEEAYKSQQPAPDPEPSTPTPTE